jgi:hypothetical protein
MYFLKKYFYYFILVMSHTIPVPLNLYAVSLRIFTNNIQYNKYMSTLSLESIKEQINE